MPPEARLRARVRMWLSAYLPSPGLWTSIEHGRAHHGTPEQRAREWQRLAAQGVKKGIPDVMVWYRGLCMGLELKVGRNTATPDQERFGAALVANGFAWRVCRSVEDVARFLHHSGVPVTGAAFQMAAAYDAELAREVVAPKKKASRAPARNKPTRAQLSAIERARASGALV